MYEEYGGTSARQCIVFGSITLLKEQQQGFPQPVRYDKEEGNTMNDETCCIKKG